MGLRVGNLTVDCDDALRIAAFWSAALDVPIREGAFESFAALDGAADGPTWFFVKVADVKTVKNRMHVDLETDDPSSEVERLLGLGATRDADKNEWGHRWTVMLDPEGNEFCASEPH